MWFQLVIKGRHDIIDNILRIAVAVSIEWAGSPPQRACLSVRWWFRVWWRVLRQLQFPPPGCRRLRANSAAARTKASRFIAQAPFNFSFVTSLHPGCVRVVTREEDLKEIFWVFVFFRSLQGSFSAPGNPGALRRRKDARRHGGNAAVQSVRFAAGTVRASAPTVTMPFPVGRGALTPPPGRHPPCGSPVGVGVPDDPCPLPASKPPGQ